METEVWKAVPGYEGLYSVSNLGNILSLERETRFGNRIKVYPKAMLCPSIDSVGYARVSLSNGKVKPKRIHRLVAQLFIPNPNNLPCINHKDGDRSNPRASNLEWCSNRYNSIHGAKSRQKTSKYTGVCYVLDKRRNSTGNPWRASTRVNGKKVSIGSFKTESEAAGAYYDFIRTELGI